ncbi:hypothetical protein JXA47_01325 [Candidatus Sumerlaeota bacterium]|nr:hypothetical protein [Candidatus Sumerlaeota bacterium]
MKRLDSVAGSGRSGSRRHGLTRIGEHEIFAEHREGDWYVVVNEHCVDWLNSKHAAMDVVRRLAQALQLRLARGSAR